MAEFTAVEICLEMEAVRGEPRLRLEAGGIWKEKRTREVLGII